MASTRPRGESRRIQLAGVAAVLLLVVLAVGGQQQRQDQEQTQEPFRLRVDVELVNLNVSVLDARGRFRTGLRSQNFRVWEDDVPEEVAHFSAERAPIRVLLLVEANPAVFLIRHDHISAARHLLASLRPADEVALLTFSDTVELGTDFTTDKQYVERVLERFPQFSIGRAEIRTLEAVRRAVEWMGTSHPRTALLLIGTGLESGDPADIDPVLRNLSRNPSPFFALAAGPLLRAPVGEGGQPPMTDKQLWAQRYFREAENRLQQLAAASGGEAFFPRRAEELPALYQGLAERLRNIYSVGYYPTDRTRDGRYRKIRVELVDDAGQPMASGGKTGARILTRPGYFARREP